MGLIQTGSRLLRKKRGLATVFASYFEGANNSTDFVDVTGKTINIVNGSPVISTAQFQQGSSSLYLLGNARLEVPSHPDFAFGNGNFYIEFYAYTVDRSDYRTYPSFIKTSAPSFFLMAQSDIFLGNVYWYCGASDFRLGTIVPPLNNWNKFVFKRESGVVTGLINDVVDVSWNNTVSIPQLPLSICGYSSNIYGLNGYIDSLIIKR